MLLYDDLFPPAEMRRVKSLFYKSSQNLNLSTIGIILVPIELMKFAFSSSRPTLLTL